MKNIHSDRVPATPLIPERWWKGYPVKFERDGDSFGIAAWKMLLEIDKIYAHLNELSAEIERLRGKG
jgi:hypothetical protein